MSETGLRVYAAAAIGGGPKRPPRENQPTPVPPPRRPVVTSDSMIDAEIVRILDAIPASGESVLRAFDRKEREVRALVAELTRAERTALEQRLAIARKDELHASFARLTLDRRVRLLAFISERKGAAL